MGKEPVFICVVATTETAKIPGLSAAGKYPELTDYTPPADVELIFYGGCRCIQGVPVTPEGIPTPALITMSALKLAEIPCFVVSGGLRVKPHLPIVEVGGKHGFDIRTGKAVEGVEEIVDRARVAGESFSKVADYLVIGESIPGGTTTALGVMLAMGVDARGKVSSSMPSNPHQLKLKVVEEGMSSAGIGFGDFREDGLRAVACVGDPMIPAFAGLVLGAAGRVPVMLAGGTQMGAVLSFVKAMDPRMLRNLVVGTTRWIVEDSTSDLKGIVRQIGRVGVLAADLDFSGSKHAGLRAYEDAVVKEGVGAGGVCIAAMLKSRGLITKESLLREVEKNYRRLVA